MQNFETKVEGHKNLKKNKKRKRNENEKRKKAIVNYFLTIKFTYDKIKSNKKIYLTFKLLMAASIKINYYRYVFLE